MPYLLIPSGWEYTTSTIPSELPYLTSNIQITADLASWGWTVIECVHVLPRIQELGSLERERGLEELWRSERIRREELEDDMEDVRTMVRERASRPAIGRVVEEDGHEESPPPYRTTGSYDDLLDAPPSYGDEDELALVRVHANVEIGEAMVEQRVPRARWARLREVLRVFLDLQTVDGRMRLMRD